MEEYVLFEEITISCLAMPARFSSHLVFTFLRTPFLVKQLWMTTSINSYL